MQNKWMRNDEKILLFLYIFWGIAVLLLFFTGRKVDFHLKLLFILPNSFHWRVDKRWKNEEDLMSETGNPEETV